MSHIRLDACTDISIAPEKDLEMTAQSIGEILGVNFRRDFSGEYEEFPAYMATSGDARFVLLGPPAPE